MTKRRSPLEIEHTFVANMVLMNVKNEVISFIRRFYYDTKWP